METGSQGGLMDFGFDLDLEQFDPTIPSTLGETAQSKYNCPNCFSNNFHSKDGGALVICKSCGHVLKNHVENIEHEFD